MRAASLLILATALSCGCDTTLAPATAGAGGDDSASTTGSASSTGVTAVASGSGGAGGASEEEQPTPAAGDGVKDATQSSLHGHSCGGKDWQLVNDWLLLPHAAIETVPADEMERCVSRFAGWVTNEADAADVSRASVYAALDAAGQCDADTEWTGAILPVDLCASVNPGLDPAACAAKMQTSKGFGIRTLAAVIAAGKDLHKNDPPLLAAWLSTGEIACGGDDRWKLAAPEGYVDRFTQAYNAVTARSKALPTCSKTLIMTVALYTGMDKPGDDMVEEANGCWTFERVAKENPEWKICNYDGTVHHPSGDKWAYDDTNTNHGATTEKQRILDCQGGVDGRGYVYMTNRGQGWPKRVTTGVRVHFAEIYSGQYEIDDQFALWKSGGKVGDPMINLGEPTTGATTIHDKALKSCKEVVDGEYLGIYVYPEPLRDARMSALVRAMNECTE